MFRKILVVSSILFSIFSLEKADAATIRISAPKIQLELAPGETYNGEILAENPTEEATKVKIYVEDWVYSPGGTGEKKFTPAGTTPLSCAKWITFSPSEDNMAPFGRVTTRYTINVPQDAKGSYFAVLFYETILGNAKDEEGVNVLVTGRIGALFFVEIKGSAVRDGKISSLEIKAPTGNKPMELVTEFQNTGNTDVALGGNFLIMDEEGKIQGRGEINKIYTFPGSTEKGTTQWIGRLAKGRYTVLTTYSLGKGKSLVEEKPLIIE